MVLVGVTTLLLFFMPVFGSYLIYQSIEEQGETVNIALIQPNLDPYTEKFDPQIHARHVAEFSERQMRLWMMTPSICLVLKPFFWNRSTKKIHPPRSTTGICWRSGKNTPG